MASRAAAFSKAAERLGVFFGDDAKPVAVKRGCFDKSTTRASYGDIRWTELRCGRDGPSSHDAEAELEEKELEQPESALDDAEPCGATAAAAEG